MRYRERLLAPSWAEEIERFWFLATEGESRCLAELSTYFSWKDRAASSETADPKQPVLRIKKDQLTFTEDHDESICH